MSLTALSLILYIVQYILYSILLAYFFLFIGTQPYQIKHFCLNNGGGQLDWAPSRLKTQISLHIRKNVI